MFEIGSGEWACLDLCDTPGVHIRAEKRAQNQSYPRLSLAALADEQEHFLPLCRWNEAVAHELLQGHDIVRFKKLREESKPFLRLWCVRIVADRKTVAAVILVRCEMPVKEQCTVLHMNPVVVKREVRRIAFHPHGVDQSGDTFCNPLRKIRLDAVVDLLSQLVLVRDSALGREERAVYALHRVIAEKFSAEQNFV